MLSHPKLPQRVCKSTHHWEFPMEQLAPHGPLSGQTQLWLQQGRLVGVGSASSLRLALAQGRAVATAWSGDGGLVCRPSLPWLPGGWLGWWWSWGSPCPTSWASGQHSSPSCRPPLESPPEFPLPEFHPQKCQEKTLKNHLAGMALMGFLKIVISLSKTIIAVVKTR